MPGYEWRVVDSEDKPVQPGEVGELVMRGSMVTPGYWNLPDASAEALRGGWLHTGDLMELQDDGVLRFVDRRKDMVKPGGENVYCIEVELALAEHPAVRECAVIGVPDKKWGEAVKAIVAARAPVTAEELDTWCLERLAAYKRPRWYTFVEALPRNALEKVVKTELRAAHDEATSVRLPERT
jgi:acyl-CoA synthetase (AMP-forming)/AMP-acid ligase II